MAAVHIRITHDDLRPALRRMILAGGDPTPVMRAMGTTFKGITERAFNSTGSSMRPEPWPAKRGGSPSNLKRSGLLWHSFHLTVTSHGATVSNPTPYAAIHQFGGTIKGNPLLKFKVGNQWISKAEVKIPARPFYPIRSGALTPEASAKIADAGMRVMMKVVKVG